jgi:hypothetical protein
LFRSGDFFENFVSGLGPDEWLGVGIVLFQVLHDGVFQLGDALEGAASNAVSGDLCEEAFGLPPKKWTGLSCF